MQTDLLIKKLEKIIGTKLEKVSVEDIVSQGSGYVVDEKGDIIGLNLASLKLTSISFLKNLTNLAYLILKENQIEDIKVLENLKNITYLNLEENHLKNVSSTLSCLRKLTNLFLRRNSISDISFVKNLESLIVLDLSENEISDVSYIKELQYLKRLDLDFNQITILPKEVTFLKELEHLSIIENLLETPPQNIADTGLESIKSYFRNRKKNIFISYSHEDVEWFLRVRKHLRALENHMPDSNVWEDTRIRAGEKWKDEISKALSETKIAVLLISPDFLSSKFIKESELPPLLKAAQNKGTTILPLVIKPSIFKKLKNLSQYQAVNDPDKPLMGLSNLEQEKVLAKLTDIIYDILSTDDSGDE